jgi:hypothetical protein
VHLLPHVPSRNNSSDEISLLHEITVVEIIPPVMGRVSRDRDRVGNKGNKGNASLWTRIVLPRNRIVLPSGVLDRKVAVRNEVEIWLPLSRLQGRVRRHGQRVVFPIIVLAQQRIFSKKRI